VQKLSLVWQRRWLFRGATICALGSVSFRPKLTSAATDAQSQVSAPADIRHPNMNDRTQSEAAIEKTRAGLCVTALITVI